MIRLRFDVNDHRFLGCVNLILAPFVFEDEPVLTMVNIQQELKIRISSFLV